MYPESIKNLIESFKYLPGIGEKTAERLAFSVIELEEEQIKLFSSSLLDVKKRIHKCNICNSLTEDEICYVCSDNTRDSSVLCVVDDYKSVFLFERLGKFNGKYHVLDGLISPLDGINPEDIGLDKLLNRIKKDKFNSIEPSQGALLLCIKKKDWICVLEDFARSSFSPSAWPASLAAPENPPSRKT